MKPAAVALAALLGSSLPANAHGYKFGAIEILHPAIVETGAGQSCAHLLIRNSGPSTDYFLGARVDAGSRTQLMTVESGGTLAPAPARIAIAAGETLDLHHGWCLLVSGLKHQLVADMGVEPGELIFEKAGTLNIEFMIDSRPPE